MINLKISHAGLYKFKMFAGMSLINLKTLQVGP